MPVSPVTGRLDAFEWKVPLAELAHEGARVDSGVLDAAAPLLDASPTVAPPLVTQESAAPADPQAEPSEAAAPQVADQEPSVHAAPTAEPKAAPLSPRRPAPADAVIPLVHAPDDPGPETEPVAAEPAEQQRRFPSLFR